MFYAARGAAGGVVTAGAAGTDRVRYRNMPREVALRTYRAHRAMYDKQQDSIKGDPRAPKFFAVGAPSRAFERQRPFTL